MEGGGEGGQWDLEGSLGQGPSGLRESTQGGEVWVPAQVLIDMIAFLAMTTFMHIQTIIDIARTIEI